MAERDTQAFALISGRRFDDAALVAFELEMATRRLIARVYGALRRNESTTYLGTLTFFGASELVIENDQGAFPRSAYVANVAFAYDDDEAGTAEFRGRSAWAIRFSFDGVAYEEHPAVFGSFADDLETDGA